MIPPYLIRRDRLGGSDAVNFTLYYRGVFRALGRNPECRPKQVGSGSEEVVPRMEATSAPLTTLKAKSTIGILRRGGPGSVALTLFWWSKGVRLGDGYHTGLAGMVAMVLSLVAERRVDRGGALRLPIGLQGYERGAVDRFTPVIPN